MLSITIWGFFTCAGGATLGDLFFGGRPRGAGPDGGPAAGARATSARPRRDAIASSSMSSPLSGTDGLARRGALRTYKSKVRENNRESYKLTQQKKIDTDKNNSKNTSIELFGMKG